VGQSRRRFLESKEGKGRGRRWDTGLPAASQPGLAGLSVSVNVFIGGAVATTANRRHAKPRHAISPHHRFSLGIRNPDNETRYKDEQSCQPSKGYYMIFWLTCQSSYLISDRRAPWVVGDPKKPEP
jgi:hypothetical protein